MLECVRAHIIEQHKLWQNHFNNKYAEPVKYTVGKIVFIRTTPRVIGEPIKLQLKYRSPLIVIIVLPNDDYQVGSRDMM